MDGMPVMLWKRQHLVLRQHTRVWRYFSTMKLLGKRRPHGKPPPLRIVLHHRLRYRLERRGRSAPSAPPGAFRTPWGWHRISQTWAGPPWPAPPGIPSAK